MFSGLDRHERETINDSLMTHGRLDVVYFIRNERLTSPLHTKMVIAVFIYRLVMIDKVAVRK